MERSEPEGPGSERPPSLGEFLREVAPDAPLAEHLERLEQHRALERELAALAGEEAPDEDPLAGYELLEEVHRGGQGVVHRAIQRSTKRQVAVKLLLEGPWASPRHLRRFEREVQLVATLDHPGIATVHDSGVSSDGRPFLVMEWIEGVPADRRLRRAGGPPEATTAELLTLFLKICRAVHHAHQRGVLHRDLKPGNILVDAAGEPHVLDFGLAASAEDDAARTRLTRTGEFMGTLAYASPEQVSGVPEEVDVRSDVYALGVILYELLTGRAPYAVDGSVVETVRAIVESAPRPPSHWRRVDSRGGRPAAALAGVDRDLDVIVLGALAKEKSRRYRDVGALIEDLERHQTGRPIRARADSALYVLRKALARHRVGAAAAAVTLAALVVATVVSLVSSGRARRAAEQAQVEAAKAEETAGVLTDLLLSISPDRARGRSVTVREVLDEAARALDASPPESPEVELDLRRTVGETYLLLALPEEAERHWARAAALAGRVHGPRSLERAAVLARLSRARREVGRFEDAEAAAREGLALLDERGDGAGDGAAGARAALHAALANTLTLTGRHAEAEPCFERAIALTEASAGPESDALAELLAARAELLERRGDLEPALALLRRSQAITGPAGRALSGPAAVGLRLGRLLAGVGQADAGVAELRRAHADLALLFGPGHPRTLLARAHLANALSMAHGFAEVEQEYRALLAERPRLEGLDAVTADGLTALGELATQAGEFDVAAGLHRAALERYDALFTTSGYERGIARGHLGWCLVRLGRVEEARALIDEALAIVRTLAGADTVQEGIYRQQLGWVRNELEGPPAAAREVEAALALYRERLPEGHGCERGALVDLGLFEYLAGDRAAAEGHLREALRLHETFGGGPVLAGKALDRLVYPLLEEDRLDEALECAERAVALLRDSLSARHPDLAEALNGLGMCLLRRGVRPDEAREALDEALEIMEAQGPDYPRTTFVLGNLGLWVYQFERDPEAAGEWFERALEHGERTGGERHPGFAFLLANRAQCHLDLGRPAEAVPLLERSLARLEAAGHPLADAVRRILIGACERSGDREAAERHRAAPEVGQR